MSTARALRLLAGRSSFQLIVATILALLVLAPESGRRVEAQAPPCDIVCENAKTGNPATEWDIIGSGDANIQGFATDISVNRGQAVDFKISSLTGYDIHIYRLGYYNGNGARKVGQILGLPGNVTQPDCANDPATGLVDCGNWSVSATWTTDTNVPSGIFIAKLTRSGGTSSHIPFIVRDDNYAADMLFQTSDTTWQVYNRYGGGSLYCSGPISNDDTVYDNAECPGRAVKVSYNRPITTRGNDPTSFLFNAEYPMVRWLEQNGYKVKYWSGVDSDRFGAHTGIGLTSDKKPKIFLSVGHDEYWSGPQRTNVESARAAGVNLAFFSGNEMFWKTRWEDSIDGTTTPHRTLAGYKESLHNSEIDGLPNMWTGTWRDGRFSPPADGGNPENSLTGTLWTVNSGTAAITVGEKMGKLRLWRGISGVADLPVGGSATLGVDTLGYEWDEDVDNGARPAGLMRLSQTTVNGVQRVTDAYGVQVATGSATHTLTLYRHQSGALVFGAGTVQWSWGLDGNHDRGNPTTHPPDVRLQQATVNLFADMGNVQPVLPSGSPLLPASPSSDASAPTSAITTPGSGSLHAMNAPVFIKGTASDTGGQVGAVEVSTDNGATWNRATNTTSWLYRWTPTAPGSYTIKSRAIDDSGNIETLGPSVVVDVTSPSQAPGGPVLVVTSAANPFSSYYTEILRAEGLNIFSTADIGAVSGATLTGFDVVILGSMALSAGQVAMFTDWVTAGGNLIAMRPDKQLYGLLGLTDAAATLSNAYLLVDGQGAPGTGIVNVTMQFHGTADLATLNGAAAVATLYSNATTPTPNPAVTLRPVGILGGQAVAFLYDLAQSVVQTRQGNPAWAGQDRDPFEPIRSDDMFFGPFVFDPQPDWNNLAKVAIPIADEQQRLLANAILHVNQDRKPLPRFWYFPRDEKAVVVMTGDAHGSSTSTSRLNELIALNPPNCSVDDWECLRATLYFYPDTPSLFDGGPGGVASYVTQGFEMALHPNTGCLNYTASSFDQTLSTQLDAIAQAYPSMPPPRTNRTHCIVWSDYTSQAEVDLQHGIRLDTTYYYWPGTWVQDRPGFFTGSGMPMRFAKQTGEIIDVYQAATQMTDEVNGSQTYPFTINTLLDRAIGAEGYYGAFVANMHGDGGLDSDVSQGHIVASALAHGVPVVSAEQMLDWLDGRNNSSFGSLAWDGTTLSFTVTTAPGANGLRGMVPNFAAGSLEQITRNGQPVVYALQTIKGVTYAFFDATNGSYAATYLPDLSPPVISGVSATPQGATSALVAWTTDEGATTRVDYGTSAASLNQNATNATLAVDHALTLNTLSPNTTYHYRVTSVDFFGNSTTFPAPPAAPLTFATPPELQGFLDTTATDFSAGTPGVATLVAETENGEVILKPTDGSEFFGTALPAGWLSDTWNASGSVTVSGGQLLLNNGWARRNANYTPGRSLEFVANFGPDAFQHSGFAQNFNCGEPWAIFSTNGTTNQVWARTTTNGCTGADINTPLAGNWIGATHRFRIEWNATDVVYFIDGTEVVRHTVTISPQMQMLAASDFDDGGANPFLLALDWERLSPYPATGAFESRVFDAGSSVSWYSVNSTAGLPAGTALALEARVGNTPTPDGTWTAFMATAAGDGQIVGSAGSKVGRYVQYRATLSTTDSYFTPDVRSVTVNHAIGVANTAPVAVDDDQATTPEDTAYVYPASGAGSLTANDTDAETPEQLTVIEVSTPANGIAVLNLDGTVSYTPNEHFNGLDAFTYTVSDGSLTDVGLVTITVSAVNDAPVGVADPSPLPGSFYQAIEDTQLIVLVGSGVLANDTDADHPPSALTAVVHTAPEHGALTLNADGSFTYTPALNYSGPDGFLYRVSDGTAQSAPIGASILVQGVNDAPVANNDAHDLSRSGVPVSVTAIVRSGATAVATTALHHGFATGHPVTITGAVESEYNGSFIVTATDATTFSYTVSGTPASPATGTIAATANDATRTIAAPGVLGNDTDLDGPALTASLDTTTTNGTLVFNTDGSFTYTPTGSFAGVDSFTYTVSDGIAPGNQATATITVHNEMASQVMGTSGGTVSTGDDGAGASPTDTLETSVTTPIEGTVTITEGPISGANAAPGHTYLGQQVDISISTINEQNPLTDPDHPLNLIFTLDASQVAPNQDHLTTKIFRNGAGVDDCPGGPLALGDFPCVSNRATVAGNDLKFHVKALKPSQWNLAVLVAGDGSRTTAEDTTLNDTVAGLSGHPNPASLTFAKVSDPAHGALTVNANGSFAYTPALNYNGADSFTYSASDGLGGIGEGTVSITVTAVNDVPSFTKGANQSVQKNSGAQSVGGWATSLSAGPANEAGQTLSFNVSHNNAPLFSVPPAIAANGTLTYTPAAGASGVATVTVSVSDNGGIAGGGVDTSATQDFTITVIDPLPIATCQNVTVTASLLGTAIASINNGSYDPDGGSITLAQVPPGPYSAGQTSVTLNVTDQASQVASCNATVTVTPFAAGAAFGFEEASGTTVLDSSGNQNNGTMNGPVRTTTGRFGKGMQFDGVNDLITVADSNSLDLTSAMTLMAWVKVNTQTGWRNVMLKRNGNDLAYGLYSNNNQTALGVPDGYVYVGGVGRSVTGTDGAVSGRWMHIAVTYGGGSLKMYLNGMLHRTVAQTGNVPATTGPLTLGGNQVWLDEFFSGEMDEVRVLGLSLTVEDIRTLMRTPVVAGTAPPATSTTGLVAAYSFNDGTATDNTGLGHNGVLNGPVAAPGIYGQALSFDGTNDKVTIADANDLDLTTGMTLEAWVRPDSLNVADWRNIILKEGPQGLVYSLYASDQAQHSAALVRIANNDRDVRTADPLPLNTWSHVVATYDKTQGLLMVWVDGVPRDDRAITGDIQVSTGSLFIGGNQFWGEYFHGRIDNVRIYNRALNIVEIQTNQFNPIP